LPISFSFQIPAIIIEDRFSRLGERKHLDPTLDTKQARNSAQYYRMLQFRTQMLAWALRCDFNNAATRSEGCAPCPTQ
jgi:hypothetical protein